MASSFPADVLKQLSTVSESLNKATSQFNEQINSLEEALASYNLGVSAWADACTINHEDYDDYGGVRNVWSEQIAVGYEKRSSKWCLAASSFFPDSGEGQDWILRDAPRQIRMKALEGIPKLLGNLIEEAIKLTQEVSDKTAEARKLANSIQPKKGQ
jgi:hypothetical protein